MRSSFLVFVLSIVWGSALAQAPASTFEKVTSVEGITEYRLSNGLTVLLFPDPTKQTVTVNVTYLVGSRHEGYGESGMAHLLEHMLFLGSKDHPKPVEEFRSHGARWNGTTNVDRTNYFETIPAGDENLKWAIDVEADRMVNSFVAKEALDKEMTVVRNEFEMGENSPGRVLFQRALASAFQWHNYGKSTIGSKADLENVPIDKLQAFYRKYYQPDNAVLMIAGKLDEAKTIALVATRFAKVPRPARKLEPTYTLDPVQDGERTVAVRRVGDTQETMVMYHIPDGAHPDMPALDVLSSVLASGPSSRLHKALVETKKAASAGGGVWVLREPGIMYYEAVIRKEASLEDARETLLRVVHNITQEPPTKEEVERAKATELKNIDLALNDSERIGLIMSESISRGDWRLFFLYRDNIKKVTPEEVLRVAKHYLKEDNRTVASFKPVDNPDRSEIPALTSRTEILKDFKGSAAIAQGEAFDSSVENIEKRLDRSSLASGMKLVLLAKKTRGATVHGVVTLHYADVDKASNTNRAPVMANAMLMRGTKKHTRQQIQDELDRLKARVSPGMGGANTTRFQFETTRENVPGVLRLLAEILREPSFPENEFEQLKQASLANFENARRDPQALASTVLRQHMSPYPAGDVRRIRLPEEEIEETKATTLDAVKAWYSSVFGASNSELAMVGDFDPPEMKKLAAELFGDWKSPVKFTRVPFAYKPVEAFNKAIETPDKANAMFVAGLPLKLNELDPDYPALSFANYIFGGGSSSRLFSRIRTKEGLSYGVMSSLQASPKFDAGSFMALAIAAPQNVPKVESTFKEELTRALKEGFLDQEIEEAKSGWLQQRATARSIDQSLVIALSDNEYEGRTLQYQADVEKRVAALTSQQMVEALRRHVDPEKLSYVKAGDFKKAGVTP